MKIATGAFWKASLERAINTAAQSVIGLLTANATPWVEIDLKGGALTVGVATGVSLLKSIVVATATDGGPSIGNVEKVQS